MKGKPKTPEHRKKLSEAAKRRWSNPEERRKQSERFKGRKLPQLKGKTYEEIYGEERAKELRKRRSEENRRRWREDKDYRERMREFFRKNNPSRHPDFRKKLLIKRRGICPICGKETNHVKAHLRLKHIENIMWNEDGLRKVIKAIRRKPTTLERKFMEIIEKYNLPYKYVGNGEVWIGRMNPDFINTNGKKVVIEILGDYWHTSEEFEERKQKFTKYGFECIGIWEHELYELSEEEVLRRIEVGVKNEDNQSDIE